MKKQFAFVFFIGVMFACGSNNSGNTSKNFISDTLIITDDYPQLEEEVIPIMEQLQMCTTSDTINQLPPCTNKYFQVFKYRPDRSWTEGFIVEMIPGLFGSPVHQIIVVEAAIGKYQIINQYFGHLLEMRTTPSGFNDLLVGYDDPEFGIVAIRHEWKGTKYDIVDVEEINNHLVKPEYKDSINALFLSAFAAGH